MYVSYSNEVCAILLVVLIKVRYMLEIVCVYIAVCSSYVRLYIVIELDDFECPSLGCQFIGDRVEDLSVWCR